MWLEGIYSQAAEELPPPPADQLPKGTAWVVSRLIKHTTYLLHSIPLGDDTDAGDNGADSTTGPFTAREALHEIRKQFTDGEWDVFVRNEACGTLRSLEVENDFFVRGRCLISLALPDKNGEQYLEAEDLKSGQKAARISGPALTRDGVRQFAGNPGGSWLLIPGSGQLKVWEPASGNEKTVDRSKTSETAVLSPDGRWLRAGTTLFDLHDSSPIRSGVTLPTFLSFSSDGRWLCRNGSSPDEMREFIPLDDSVVYARHVRPLDDKERQRYLTNSSAPIWEPPAHSPDIESAAQVFTALALLEWVKNGEGPDKKEASPSVLAHWVALAKENLHEAKKRNPSLCFEPGLILKDFLQKSLGALAEASARAADWNRTSALLQLQNTYCPGSSVPLEALRKKCISQHVQKLLEDNIPLDNTGGVIRNLNAIEPGLGTHLEAGYRARMCLNELALLLQKPWSPEVEHTVFQQEENLSKLAAKPLVPPASDWPAALTRIGLWLLEGNTAAAVGEERLQQAMSYMDRAQDLLQAAPHQTEPHLQIDCGTLVLELRDFYSRGAFSKAAASHGFLRMCWYCLRADRPADAERYLQLALKEPHDPITAKNLFSRPELMQVVLLARSGKCPEAHSHLKGLMEKNPDAASAWGERELKPWLVQLSEGKDPFVGVNFERLKKRLETDRLQPPEKTPP
jgi:hypothetical protein